MNPKIGVNFPSWYGVEGIEAGARYVADKGFDVAEICLNQAPFIIGGKICDEFVKLAYDAIKKSPIPMVMHIGSGLDLRKTEEFALHKQVLMASVEVCSRLELPLLTLHFEEASPKEDVEQAFFEAHMEAADYGAKKGVYLCIENIETENYHRVVDMVKKANHKNFGMTLDTGHLNLSTKYLGQDFKAAVKECAPYVKHIHVSDNTGKFELTRITDIVKYRALNSNYRMAFGCGDIHLPPGWGEIDFDFIFKELAAVGYDGIFLCEYMDPKFNLFHKTVQENVRAKVNAIFNK